MKPRRVVVLGDVMLDVVVRPRGALAPTSDTPASIRVGRGASGANVALALHATGHDVSYVGARGDDAAGQIFADALSAAGVRSALQVIDAPTGTVVALVSANAQRAMLSDRGANSRLTPEFVVEQLLSPFDHLHVSGYLLLDVATRRGAVAALALARDRGATASVDVCSVGPLRLVTARIFRHAARAATYLFANEEEALALSDSSDVDRALESLVADFEEVVVTRGERGALGATKVTRESVAAREVTVLDTTGAGDAATGAYLGARLAGRGLRESLDAAMDASAQVIQGLGASG